MSGILNPSPITHKGKFAIVGGSAAVKLYRAGKPSAVAGDITACHADGIQRIVVATDDTEPVSGIIYPMFGKEGLYYKDDDGDWVAPLGSEVLIFGVGETVEAEIGAAINTGTDAFITLLSPGTKGLVKAVDTAGANHFVCAQLLQKGVYAEGDLAKVLIISAQGPTAAGGA